MLHNKLQASKPSGSEAEDISIFFLRIFMTETRPLARGHLDPWDLHLNKLVRGELGNASNQYFKQLGQVV